MSKPTISVVMSIYNSAASLVETIESIQAQSFSNFEFIIIDDGSNDNSATIIKELQKHDPRIRPVTQTNQGLTKALIRACELASGDFIARQDAGDISFEERFTEQLKMFESHSNLVMVSTGTHFVTPAKELLYTVLQSDSEATNGLLQTSVDKFRGPSHHGSVMFRRSTYQRVGGYRSEFPVAQDIDLWSRLIEYGEHRSTKKIYYQASLEKNSISVVKREHQIEFTKKVLQCTAARKQYGSDQSVLETITPMQKKTGICTSMSDSAYYYFIASNLMQRDALTSIRYLRQALDVNPLHIKARVKLLLLLSKRYFN